MGAPVNHILIVDDDPKFGEFVGEVAASEGFEVTLTENADAFCRQLDISQPSVVLVDLVMPKFDGIELLRELSMRRCEASIVVASGIDIRTLKAAQALGDAYGLKIRDIVTKPIRVSELRSILGKLKMVSPAVSADTLQRAIREKELFLVYQPKLDLGSGKIVGVEALVRWRLPDGHVLTPESFIPAIERINRAGVLTRWVLTNAIEQAAEWHGAGKRLQVAINLSAVDLQDAALPDSIFDICDRAGLPPSALTLEVTETAAMQDVTMMMGLFARLRLKEFRLSIDDFGAGYSSLAQLCRLPISEVKIDKSFVLDMGESTDSTTVVRAVLNLAHTLGLSVVAEGVEDAEALRILTAENCEMVQGYHICRPLDRDSVVDFADSWPSTNGDHPTHAATQAGRS